MLAWEKFLAVQEIELGPETVQKWLKPLKVCKFDACNLYLQASDSFQILWFEEHVRPKVVSSLINNNNKRIKVHIALDKQNEIHTPGKQAVKTKNSHEPQTPKFNLTFDELDPHCTFQNLLPLSSNPLSFKYLFNMVGWDPDKRGYVSDQGELAAFNPLYLCGASGTGKTHMLMSIAHALRLQGMNVVYARAETFTEHVVTAIRAGEMGIFRQGYRNIDVLILDDVHGFARKWATQEELFHTFNTLHIANKQIILSANCFPGELQFIEPRLVSRFEWGIVLSLDAPTREETKKILHAKAIILNNPLHDKIEEFLLETFSRSTKVLTKALEALVLRAHLSKPDARVPSGQLSIPFVKNVIADLILEEQQNALTPTKIIHCVAENFGIRSDDILGKAQSRDCVLPRQLSMFFCRKELKLPYTKIGDLFQKDHSTVMSSVKAIQKSIDDNSNDVMAAFLAIQKKLQV